MSSRRTAKLAFFALALLALPLAAQAAQEAGLGDRLAAAAAAALKYAQESAAALADRLAPLVPQLLALSRKALEGLYAAAAAVTRAVQALPLAELVEDIRAALVRVGAAALRAASALAASPAVNAALDAISRAADAAAAAVSAAGGDALLAGARARAEQLLAGWTALLASAAAVTPAYSLAVALCALLLSYSLGGLAEGRGPAYGPDGELDALRSSTRVLAAYADGETLVRMRGAVEAVHGALKSAAGSKDPAAPAERGSAKKLCLSILKDVELLKVSVSEAAKAAEAPLPAKAAKTPLSAK